MKRIGIDDMSLVIPSLYLPIDDLANARNIDPEKLKNGLGLINMAVCDVDEDVVTLGAEAVIDLIKRNNIKPHQLGRIYVGTESSIDGSKPLASYILGLVSQYFENEYQIENSLVNCDVVDMTFACIGAIDAMHNSLAHLHTLNDENLVSIVVATDDAQYDLESSGEYTQGAGAVAILLKHNPRLLEVDLAVGIATKDEHDFFKPLRYRVSSSVDNITKITTEHKTTPVFDGQFSNITYAKRIIEAWQHYKNLHCDVKLSDFDSFIFHLPYAYHGRRIMADLLFDDMAKNGQYQEFLKANNIEFPLEGPDKKHNKLALRSYLKARTKTPFYTLLVTEKIERGERLSSHIGNVYTASIFISLLSFLIHSKSNDDIKNLLFIAYGSGSKSKVFRGILQEKWKTVFNDRDQKSLLSNRMKITFEQYENIRFQKINSPLATNKTIKQHSSGIMETNRFARYYGIDKDF